MVGRTNADRSVRGKDARLLKRLVSSTLRLPTCARGVCRVRCLLLRLLLTALIPLLAHSSSVRAQETGPPRASAEEAILIDATRGSRWTENSHEVWLLEGNCVVQQGAMRAVADQAVLWIERASQSGERRNRVIAYFEGNVRAENEAAAGRSKLADRTWLATFESIAPLDIRLRNPDIEPAIKPQIVARGQARLDQSRDPAMSRSCFTAFVP